MKKISSLALGIFMITAGYAQKKSPKTPPPPPEPPKIEVKDVPPAPPAPPVPAEVNDDYENFLERNKNVKKLGWNSDQKITVYLKNGEKEMFDLGREEEQKSFESKYGSLPAAPPPPPPAPPAPPKVIKPSKKKV